MKGRTGAVISEFYDSDGKLRKYAALHDVGLKGSKQEKFQNIMYEYQSTLKRSLEKEGYVVINEPKVIIGTAKTKHGDVYMQEHLAKFAASGIIPKKTMVPAGTAQNTICGSCIQAFRGKPPTLPTPLSKGYFRQMFDKERKVGWILSGHRPRKR